MQDVISTINYDQHQIIRDIIKLHCPNGIELDPTYSKGIFYNKSDITPPIYKSDLFPVSDDIVKADASKLGFADGTIKSIMFDPPFVVGHTRDKPTGIIGERFHGFRYISDLWQCYDECLVEFNRILAPKGILIFKCQDTVSSGKQWFSHVHIMNKADELGFICKDLFVLLIIIS